MGREIKFRAWLKNRKKMVEVEEISFIAQKQIAYDEIEIRFNTLETFHYTQWVDFEGIELMQYTGLKDKNGVEIYEGDIVKYERNNSIYPRKIGVAEFNDKDLGSCGCCFYEHFSAGFVIKTIKPKDDDRKYFSLYDLEQCEVIGNIYEDKELLENADR